MKLLAAVAVVLAGTGGAFAAPPEVGSTHFFNDPVFRGTVFCDTLEAVTAIATAPEPDQIYAAYYMTTNDIGEPICMAIAPDALVKAVTPLGVMRKDDHNYDAWAVETDINGTVVYALYLERRTDILA